MTDFSVRLVKELKGAPLSVWMALVFARGVPVNQNWLARNTGYTDKPIHQALAYLFEHGFVTQVEAGWIISEGNCLLTLAPSRSVEAEELDVEDLEMPVEGSEFENIPVDRSNSDGGGHNRNNSDSPISIVNKGFKDSVNKTSNTNNADRKNSDSTGQFSDFPELGKALLDLGIRENARTRRLLGRITPRDVRAVVAKVREDPYHDLNETGLMIAILEGVAQRNERRGGYDSWNE